ncbi:YwgA family protein [Virgibacillus flavescens]|uniref:YwgA family protein n=1 Tax=Virgibacillus flavescens TaxID=1611422 RepID=UPI003D327F45
MLPNHAKLMHFFEVANKVTGRKKLQKMIYILQKCKVPFEEKYQFHFYGPYSEELTLRMEELCNLGFINEVKEDRSNYYQYNYSITENGQQFLEQFTLDMPEINDQVELLNGKSSRFLELVSTMLYFDDFSRDEVVEKIYTVKPKQNFTEAEIQEAWGYIDLLRQSQLHG